MKKITFLFTFLITTLSFGQELISNGNFETGDLTDWSGHANQVLTDDITSSYVGNNNNGDSSTIQVVNVEAGKTYNATFEYRWVSGATSYNLNATIKENADNPGASLGTFTCNTTPDVWHTDGLINFTVPAGITQVRIIFWKPRGNRPFRFDNVSIVEDPTASVTDLEKFNFSFYPNPVNDILNLSAATNIDSIEIYSFLGQLVDKRELNLSNAEINISNLNNGIYFIKTKIDNTIGTFRIIKE